MKKTITITRVVDVGKKYCGKNCPQQYDEEYYEENSCHLFGQCEVAHDKDGVNSRQIRNEMCLKAVPQ